MDPIPITKNSKVEILNSHLHNLNINVKYKLVNITAPKIPIGFLTIPKSRIPNTLTFLLQFLE